MELIKLNCLPAAKAFATQMELLGVGCTIQPIRGGYRIATIDTTTVGVTAEQLRRWTADVCQFLKIKTK